MAKGKQNPSQQSPPAQTFQLVAGGTQNPPPNQQFFPIIISPIEPIPTIPTVPLMTYIPPTVPRVQKVSTGIPYQWVTPGTVIKESRIWNNPKVVGDMEFWLEPHRAKLSDDERERLDSIDESLKPLEDPAWYYWPTWTQAMECGRHAPEAELRRTIPKLPWTTERSMSECYGRVPQYLQDAVKKYFPLDGNYWVGFWDRPLDDLGFINNQSLHKIIYLVGEKGSGMRFDQTRCPKRGNSYRHIMFPINKLHWISDLHRLFKDTELTIKTGRSDRNPEPFRSSNCSGFFNNFIKPIVECHPPAGKAFKVSIAVPILNIALGKTLMERKVAEKLLKHHPSFLRAPGYQYHKSYIDQDGNSRLKPAAWVYGSALDPPPTYPGDYDGTYFGAPPAVYTARTLYEYHHPKMDAPLLDRRQTMRRGHRGLTDNDEFVTVEQFWAMIVPTNETLVTFQSMKVPFIPAQVGGFNTFHFDPHKPTDMIPQGPVHGFFIFFGELALVKQYRILEVYQEGAAALNFRVAHEPLIDEDLTADCNAVISEVAIILEITRRQMEVLAQVKEATVDNTLRPEELEAATIMYKLVMSRLEVVVAAFEDIKAEAKQAQNLLFQLLNTEAAKQQAKMAEQQALTVERTAEETAVQLELAKQSSEQSQTFLVFTIITTIFLPLSFFTSYFGMNTIDIRDMEWDQSYFWKTAGSSSAMIILIVMCWAFRVQLKRGIGTALRSKVEPAQIDVECAIENPEKGGQAPGKRSQGSWNFFGRRVDKND